MNCTPFRNVKLVVFDVDGTLYDQSKLRKKMLKSLIGYYFLRPWKIKDLLIIHQFRLERETKAGFEAPNLNDKQYEWCADKLKLPIERVRSVIDKWIFNFPNKYLEACVYPGVKETFDSLNKQNIKKAIYSDYDANEKLVSMNLDADLIVSSTDLNINAMKPIPKAINYILDEFKIADKSTVLFIGDRDELDGACARNAGIPYLIINKNEAKNNFYKILSKKILNES